MDRIRRGSVEPIKLNWPRKTIPLAVRIKYQKIVSGDVRVSQAKRGDGSRNVSSGTDIADVRRTASSHKGHQLTSKRPNALNAPTLIFNPHLTHSHVRRLTVSSFTRPLCSQALKLIISIQTSRLLVGGTQARPEPLSLITCRIHIRAMETHSGAANGDHK